MTTNFPELAVPVLVSHGFTVSLLTERGHHRIVHPVDTDLFIEILYVEEDNLVRHRFAVGFEGFSKVPEMRRRVFDTRKPHWQRSFSTWMAEATFKRMEVVNQRKQIAHQRETASKIAAATVMEHAGHSIEHWRHMFSATHNPVTGEISVVEMRFSPCLDLGKAFKGLTIPEQIAKCGRVLSVLQQEGFLREPAT